MVAALADVDHFDLGRYPVFEPRRGPTVPHYVAAAQAPVLYMPIRRGTATPPCATGWRGWTGWPEAGLRRNLTQKALRQWMRERPGHRSFTVLRHPVARLYDVFCRHVLSTGPEAHADLREALRKTYKLKLPDRRRRSCLGRAAQRAAFQAFARFVAGNLAGQTSVRVDPLWATQTAVLQGMAQFALPDHDAARGRTAGGPAAAGRRTWACRPRPSQPDPALPQLPLAAIYDDETEALVRQAYQRDYVAFGFGRWG